MLVPYGWLLCVGGQMMVTLATPVPQRCRAGYTTAPTNIYFDIVAVVMRSVLEGRVYDMLSSKSR